MKTLIVSITAISLISVLAEILLTEGQTKKYIQGMISLGIIFAILTQAVSLFKGVNADFTVYNGKETVVSDGNALNLIQQSRFEFARKKIIDTLEKEGIEKVEITFAYYYDQYGKISIQNIYADTANAVIKENLENINIIDKIIGACQETINIDKEGIIIDGKSSNSYQNQSFLE